MTETPPPEARLQQMVRHIEDLRRLSVAVDSAHSTAGYHERLIAMALQLRHFLRQFPADDLAALLRGRSEPQLHEKTEETDAP